MSKNEKRGGLGRGLAALIPTAPPAEEAGPTAANDMDVVMSGEAENQKGTIPKPGSPRTIPATAPASRSANRVPSVEAITASSATDVYFDAAPVVGAVLKEIPPSEITTNPKQPRQVFDEDGLAELTHSIREFGVLQPIVVRPTTSGYELVMGERRFRAAQAAGLEKVPAIVRETADEAMLRDALLENIHRVQLNPLEEAAAYQQLLEEFGVTHEQLATRIGRSRSQVSNTIRLMNLPVPVQRRVAAGVLSAGHARALLALERRDAQEEMATRIVAEGLSVRATEELVAVTTRTERARPSTRASAVKAPGPEVKDLADGLSDLLETHVRVDVGRRKGKITVEFGSAEDLARIVAIIAPQLTQKASNPS